MALLGNENYLTELDIRIWLRDTDPTANKLLDDYEFTPEEIRTAMTLCVDYFNETHPMVAYYDYDKFPYRYHLLMGTCANLLFIAANAYRRNKLKYSIPGGAIDDQNKDPEYDKAGERLWKQYKEWVMITKRTININQGFGTIG
ncbi:hypothetical protein ACFLQL_00175 [Verrucomicrobiota bacterium]